MNISHLRILGYDAYALFKAPGRHKLQQKADRYVLVGYGVDIGTYRLLHPNRRTILVTRDVVFNEEGFVRTKFLPHHGHVGMEGESGHEDLMPSDVDWLPTRSGPGHDDDNDDDDGDDGEMQDGPEEAEDGDASRPVTPDRPAPRRSTRIHQPQVQRVLRPSTPPSPTPLAQGSSSPLASARSESPDPLTDPRCNPGAFIDRGSDVESEGGGVMLVTLDTKQKIEVPGSYNEAIKSPYAEYWQRAMQEEVDALRQFGTWELTSIPQDHPILTGKWHYDVKVKSESSVHFKARWVACGFTQQHGIDYNETFAPVMNGKAWHILYALAAEKGYKIRQFDVSNAFLNGKLGEQVYLEQPHGFVEGSHLVCRLVKSLYGLKQAANVWFKELVDILLKELGFKQTQSDSVVFVKDVENGHLIIGGHVDDLLAIAPSESVLNSFSEDLAKHLKIKSGQLDTFLGVQAGQDPRTGTITIHQQRKIVDLLTDFGMLDSHPVSTPMQHNIELSRADCPTTDQG